MGISKNLTEEDVKFRYINEAITSKGWSKDSIFMEQKVKFTDGKINLHGNLVHREKPNCMPTISRSARLLIMKLIRHWRRYNVSWG